MFRTFNIYNFLICWTWSIFRMPYRICFLNFWFWGVIWGPWKWKIFFKSWTFFFNFIIFRGLKWPPKIENSKNKSCTASWISFKYNISKNYKYWMWGTYRTLLDLLHFHHFEVNSTKTCNMTCRYPKRSPWTSSLGMIVIFLSTWLLWGDLAFYSDL